MSKDKLVIGILAHVDAGKTTLAESILYQSGNIRTLGRVDHKNAFLDTYELERERGITIFSKQANVSIGEKQVVLLDTPGHVDFSAEMERTLQVLDYAVLVISGADGVQGHVETLWKLLSRYGIPTYLFVNKMDQEGTNQGALQEELQQKLDRRCVDFTQDIHTEAMQEALAECDEQLLEAYLDGKKIEREAIRGSIAKRMVFPCYFGSALRVTGVQELLDGIQQYIKEMEYPEAFGARVYKIGRDDKGARLTYMKITGGSIKVKMQLQEEKVNQIRIYSGATYETIGEVEAGSICAVVGLEHTYAGQGLGIEEKEKPPVLEPVLTYQILCSPENDVYQTFLKLRTLEEEEPQMQVMWKEELAEIHVKLMGEVQRDVWKRMIEERFDLQVEFGESSIVYKETITKPAEGVGHVESLRHYAEVHLLLEPLEQGRGLLFDTVCSEEVLDKNWQQLILSHVKEQTHLGVLTGAAVTDIKVTLLGGKAHQRHTEGGDFRQAVDRAIRHGLKRGKPLLLEPVYAVTLTIPQETIGRAMSDMQKLHGVFEQPEVEREMSVLRGQAPVATMQGYQTEVLAYTKGRGQLSLRLQGYAACHNQLEYQYKEDLQPSKKRGTNANKTSVPAEIHDEKELTEIFERTYGKVERKKSGWETASKKVVAPQEKHTYKATHTTPKEQYLLVDGYNIIFAWEELKEIAKSNIEGARNKLLDIMCNYQGYQNHHVIVVFDAYKVPGNTGSQITYNNIHVVYTKEAETADQYIEKTVPTMVKKYRVTVATSDALEQMIIMGQGADRLSARGLEEEVERVNKEMREHYL